jgi:hypothetical protein
MKRRMLIIGAVLLTGLMAQDRYTLIAPNGVAFSEFRGYDTWQPVAPSLNGNQIKVITANPVMIAAYKDGFPANGKPAPEGGAIAKIEWAKKPSAEFPARAIVPGDLEAVQFMLKDSKRFPDTNGWGYADFVYDAASSTFKPRGNASFATAVCHTCHTAVPQKDFVFTEYQTR